MTDKFKEFIRNFDKNSVNDTYDVQKSHFYEIKFFNFAYRYRQIFKISKIHNIGHNFSLHDGMFLKLGSNVT